ncbi:MAG: serine/threonine protein kinase [Gemmatales bacterium]|nr:serine/threonine protein kinase [Gemmatales bacterium]MDW8386036.1 serine/threonine-protein kinase [Gemmatales bacterium]
MPAPTTVEAFLELVQKSRLVEPDRLDAYVLNLKAEGLPNRPKDLAGQMLRDGLLTDFQARQLLLGKWRGFIFGKYRVLEQLGSGGTSTVFLCEHTLLRRHVAIKILPVIRAQSETALARFYREARAAAALNHPNIVRAFDVDQEGDIHYIVMEFVDGASLHDIVRQHGPMDVTRACHYIRQAACGLQHIHENRLIHRDIKPGNLLLDRQGTIKILDLGLARFFADAAGDSLTTRFDNQSMMGTADYIAPEQAMDLHSADIRADIYSLGASFYFLLAGRPPFDGKTITQKLIQHQTQLPKPIAEVRPEVPAGLSDLIDRMMQKNPADRFQTPAEVAEALEPWTREPIAPPPEHEMPRRSAAVALHLAAEEEVVIPRLANSGIRRLSKSRLQNPPSNSSSSVNDSSSSRGDSGRDPSPDSQPPIRTDPSQETSVEPRATEETEVHLATRPALEVPPPPAFYKETAQAGEEAARPVGDNVSSRGVTLSLSTFVLTLAATAMLSGLVSALAVWLLLPRL